MNNIDNHLLEFGIAVIGLAGRFPGANTIDQFWENLKNGVESIQFFSDAELKEAGVPELLRRDSNYVAAKGILDDIAGFDASFFNIPPREAELIDPQQRIFLECAWEALEHAGYDPYNFAGRIGTFASASKNTYLLFNLMTCPELHDPLVASQVLIANDKDYVSTRTSYKLNLRGPSITVQSACSSSLVALHLACQSLMSGECEMALAGGVAIDVPHKAGYLYQSGGIFSPDGHCRVFDSNARGTVFGQGAGVVILKPFAKAIEDRDCIHAVIRSSAVNNDGANKTGFTAPSVEGQRDVIMDAIELANIDPSTIAFVEAHGTGTVLGDPIEFEALKLAFSNYTKQTGFCAIGSAKSNIGHLNAASGIAGFIKSVLTLKNAEIPPSLHFERPNPHIDFNDSPFFVSQGAKFNPAHPRRGSLSSFGIGGTNAHVVLEQGQKFQKNSKEKGWQILPISGRSLKVLSKMHQRLGSYLKAHLPELADVSYTLQVGRHAFAYRSFLVCHDTAEAADILLSHELSSIKKAVVTAPKPLIYFIFPAQGDLQTGMTAELYQTEKAYRQAFNDCSQLLSPLIQIDLSHLLFSEEKQVLSPELISEKIYYALLFSIEYSLARLWMAWGVEPQALFGDGIGAFVAACLSGVITLSEALALITGSITLTELKCQEPEIPLFSHLTGEKLQNEELKQNSYWSLDANPVSLQTRLSKLAKHSDQIFLEVGVGDTIIQKINQIQNNMVRQLGVASLSYLNKVSERQAMLTTLGSLWLRGGEPNWEALHEFAERTPLPTYPFEHKRYWIERQEPKVSNKAQHLSSAGIAAGASDKDTELKLLAIFSKLLKIEAIGIHDNFFDLGGDSLLGVELIALVKEAFNLNLPLNALFEAPTVEAITSLITRAQTHGVEKALENARNNSAADLVLDTALQPPTQFKYDADPSAILITGAAGFLGSFIVHELLQKTRAKLYCLVRASSLEEGFSRLEKALAHYGLSGFEQKDRIQIVLGDLSLANFGLSEQQYLELAEAIYSIYHCGARLSFIDPYRNLRKINVQGTRHVIEFACQQRTKHIHHVSSIAVYDSENYVGLAHADESLSLDNSYGFHTGYDESKWVSERIVAEAEKRGVPVTVYRPGNISGDSRTGVCSSSDFVGIMLRGCIELGFAPDNDAFVDVVPIDYVSRALVHLSLKQSAIGEKYNLVNSKPVRWSEMVSMIQDIGYFLQTEPFDKWRERLARERLEKRNNPMIPLLPMFQDRPLFSNRCYSGKKVTESLSGSDIRCHPMDTKLFSVYLDYLVGQELLSHSN
ncbi:polyketide synthase [Legionella nautarum]|uniref:Polyketide synthase n=1 Tax=Legionella nautarum TaxID=45070 RepID=A0A0W0WYU2_9GAMM|nr:type I polyketide synthase [Legionella nautarum]KTD37466.1 polyketide synthase [Legionella nautarum]